MTKKIDYISQMVLDTFTDVEDNVLEFRAPNASNGQIELNFNTHKVGFDKVRACFQIHMDDQVIEIPSNWGPFGGANFNSSNGLNIRIDQFNDEHHLLEVLGAAGQQQIGTIQISGPIEDLRMSIEPLSEVFAA